jgi:hypothetical protein
MICAFRKLEQVRASSFRPHPDFCAVKRLIKIQYAATLPRLYDYVFLSRHSHHHTGAVVQLLWLFIFRLVSATTHDSSRISSIFVGVPDENGIGFSRQNLEPFRSNTSGLFLGQPCFTVTVLHRECSAHCRKARRDPCGRHTSSGQSAFQIARKPTFFHEVHRIVVLHGVPELAI